MIAFLLAAAVAAAPAGDPALRDLAGLEGWWSAAGEVRGKVTRNRLRGAWRLNGKYMMISLTSTDERLFMTRQRCATARALSPASRRVPGPGPSR